MKYVQKFLLAAAALSVATVLAGSPSPAVAAQGDCSQPVSSGATPVATDCLYILRTAVGLLTCDPTCICDLNASGGNPNATDSLGCLNAAVGVPNLLNCDCPDGTTTTTVGGSTTTTTIDGLTTTTTIGGGTTTTTIGGGGGACPDTVELLVFAGAGIECTSNNDCEIGTCDAGIGRCATVTSLDTGWTGISHNADINDQQQAVATLDCAASGAPCGVCDVTGVDPVNRACRCANDNQAICDQPFVADADDCGGAVCNCYLGPPLPLSAGLTPACVVNRLANDVTGTLDVDTGAGESTVNLRSVVYLGIGQFQPCPSCNGDTTPGDGVRDGTCVGDGSPNEDDACDADAVNTTFPWVSNSDKGNGTSLDCFPDIGKNVSGTGLIIDLPLSTGDQQLTSAITCGIHPAVPELCPCGLCSGNQALTCTSNTDCAAAGAGTCANAFGDARQKQCLGDEICNDIGGGEGQCNQGPVTYCDLSLRANGVPFISCNNNGDCGVYPGFDVGTCTASEPKACFLPTIVAEGAPDPEFPVGVSTFCIAETSSPGINSVAGLPGPGRVVNQGKLVKYCGGFGGTEYVANTGCP